MKNIVIAFFMLLSTGLIAQGSMDYGSGLKINLNEDGSKNLRII